MNEKTTSYAISEIIAQQLSFPRKTTDSFMRAFAESIIEGLTTDGVVKVKGLGTFKITETEERESVSITTGERIVIPSFKRISFVADESVGEMVAAQPERPTASCQPAKAGQPVCEEPADVFSGIDVLISTPESLEDLRNQLSEAQRFVEEKQKIVAQAETSVATAKEQLNQIQQQLQQAASDVEAAFNSVAEAENEVEQAQDEVTRIEQLIDNVENNRLTVMAGSEHNQQSAETEPSEPTLSDEASDESGRHDNGEGKKEIAVTPIERKGVGAGILFTVIIALLVVASLLYFLLGRTPQEKEVGKPAKTEKIQKETDKKPAQSASKPTAPSVNAAKSETPKPTPKKKVHEPEAVPQPAKPEPAKKKAEQPKQPAGATTKPKRPSTYTIQSGETLTRIAQRFYGTKDSVRAIIRVNKFKDPDNVPAGATIQLP